MCVITLAAIGAGAAVAGTGISAIGAIGQGNAQAAEARYSSQVAKNNAIINNQNANYAIAAGEAKAGDQGMKNRAGLAALTTALAAGGTDINSGSAVDLRASKRAVGELDTERVLADTQLAAYGYRTQASNATAEAQLKTAEAGYDTTAGYLKGGGDLLSGASSIGLKFAGLRDSASGSAGTRTALGGL